MILEIKWKDKITNEEVRRRSEITKLEDIITKRRLPQLGHTHTPNGKRLNCQTGLEVETRRWSQK